MTTLPIYETQSVDQAKYMLPTTFAQERLWLLNQLEPLSTAYNIPATLRLSFLLDVGVLEQSINALIQRHEVLRTTFVASEGRPMQVIASALTLPLTVVNLQTFAETEREAEVLRLATEELRQPFDLVQGPLLRATLLHVTSDEHILLFTIHHIVFDGWSTGVLYQELVTLYRAFAVGKPSPLPELPIQYADFAIWQQERSQEEMLTGQLAYWKQQLLNAPAILELPTDRPHSVVQTYHGSTYSFTLPRKLSEALKSLSHQEGVTLYMTLVAAFQTLLYRYIHQDDVVIGTVTSGRTQVETENLIGFFVNTLVLHTDLSGNPTFRELLERVSKKFFETYTYQDVPFEYLVKELQPTRVLGRNPIFQVLLTLDPPLPDLPSGWTSIPMIAETGASKFDMSLEFEDRPQALVGRLEYSTDLFDESTVVRMVGHLQTILESIVDDPSQHIAQLPLLTQAERQLLLVDWNATQAEYPKDMCIHQLFEAQVERTPDAIAIVFEGEQLTYRQLNQRANQLARHLQQLGITSEVLVGICITRSLEMVIALWGILKAGGAYVPLDPTYPSERLAFMLQDTQAPVIVTQQRLANILPTHDAKVVYLDSDWDIIARKSEANLVNRVQPTNLAYVIYTSGSTGKPKGVMVRHQGLCNLALAQRQVFEIRAESHVLQFSSLSFDASVSEIFVTLSSGATLHLETRDALLPGPSLIEVLRQQGITVATLPPSALANLPDVELPALRTLITAGEDCSASLVARWAPGRHFFNAYGPTEATVCTTIAQCSDGKSNPPIGHPITNTQVYVLDTYQQLVPVGIPGELYVGGDGLAQGYLNQPELTAERFVQNPFSSNPKSYLYRTGDLVCYLQNGDIKFLGRIDHQVKLRGFRIELGEIEAVLNQYPDVREVFTILREDEQDDKRLVAYIVTTHKQPVAINILRDYLSEKLPTYMVPSAFVFLDALPLTPNGKVDRHALPAPESSKCTEETFVSPILMEHYQLIQIWEALLETHPIGIRDNFFNLGGHSLLAARMISQFEQMSGKKIPLATLFAGPTIEQLVNTLQQQEEKTSNYPLVAVQANGTNNPFFFLHGDWTRGAFYCFALASASGTEQPFYVLEPYRVDGTYIPATLEDMAAAHLVSLRTFQPEGPYLLGGFCNGGLLAYEMARQLHAQGQKVDLLLLINPSPPTRLGLTLRKIINHVGSLMRFNQNRQANWFLGTRHALRHLYRYLHSSNDARLQDFGQLLQVDVRLNMIFPPVEALRKDYVGIFSWLSTGYALNHYPGKITFFWASEEPHLKEEWQKIAEATEVEVHSVPGTHMTCITEHISVSAQHLSECISKAQLVREV